MTYNETYRAVYMKDKNVAGFLALFFGWLGFHRFYLGQIGLGIVYCLLIGTGISFILGLIDAVSFFIMDKDNFDLKYNRKYYDRLRDRRGTDFDRRRRSDTDYDRGARARHRREEERRNRRMDRRKTPSTRPTTRRSRPAKRANPYKQSGKEKYKDFDYQGAIQDFEKSLEIEPNDPAVHFNLACAYSLEEEVQKSLFNLQQAIANGFKDEKRIKEHEALAFVRIQPEFEAFVENNYRLPVEGAKPKVTEEEKKQEEEDLLSTQPDLLDQIKKLGDLRDKGLLTEQEFAEQKKKLLG